MAGKDGRSKMWAFLMYADSMPHNWARLLADLQVPVFVSPLHDKDVWLPEDCIDGAHEPGSPKKPHYHVLIKFASEQRPAAVLKLLEPFHLDYVERVCNYRQYARYLCHLDEESKVRYDPADVVEFSGAKYPLASAESKSTERFVALKPVFEFCRDNCVWDYQVLVDYVFRSQPDWIPLVSSRRNDIVGYMRSLEHQAQRSSHFSRSTPAY